MSLKNIRAALMDAFLEIGFTYPMKEANVPFTTHSQEPWCAVWFLNGEISASSCGVQGEDVVYGIMQVDLNYPKDIKTGPYRGDIPSYDDFELIRTKFKTGKYFTYGGTQTEITQCYRNGGEYIDEVWYKVVCTVAYRAYLQR